jgi:uncharacterized protein DUF3987
VARRKGTQDLIPRLNSLYYCPAQSTVDRVKNPTTAVRPFLSVITATPQEYIEDILTDLEIAGGFLNRCLIITGEEQEPKAIVRTPHDDAWAEMAMHMQKAVDRAPAGNMEMNTGALGLWNEFYPAWKKERRDMKAKDAQLTARIFEHVLKIAIVYAVTGGEATITECTLATAIQIGGWLQSNATRLFAATGRDRLGKCEYLILDLLLRAHGRRMYRRDLQMSLGGRGYNAETFNRAQRALLLSERIAATEEETISNRTRTMIEYVR